MNLIGSNLFKNDQILPELAKKYWKPYIKHRGELVPIFSKKSDCFFPSRYSVFFSPLPLRFTSFFQAVLAEYSSTMIPSTSNANQITSARF